MLRSPSPLSPPSTPSPVPSLLLLHMPPFDAATAAADDDDDDDDAADGGRSLKGSGVQ